MWYSAQARSCSGARARVNAKSKLHQFVPASLVRECVPGVGAFTLGASTDADEGTHARRWRARRGGRPCAERGEEARAAPRARVGAPKKVGINDPRRCFSLVLWKPDEAGGATCRTTSRAQRRRRLGLATIDLELPEGERAAAREWCDARHAVALEHAGTSGVRLLASDEDA